MHNPTFQRQGDPAPVGWSIGRAPLALRGIRFAEGEQGGAPAAPPAAGGTPAAPAPPAPGASPADVAAMLAALGKGPATPHPAPAAPAAPAAAPSLVQGFTPEQVQKLMADADTQGKLAAEARTTLAAVQKERDDAQAQLATFAREKAVTTAATGKGNAALLLDSASFQAAVKDVDLADAAALTAAVEKFVADNPAYAAAPAAPQLPGTSGGTPAGGTTDTPKTLEGAIAARLAG